MLRINVTMVTINPEMVIVLLCLCGSLQSNSGSELGHMKRFQAKCKRGENIKTEK